MITLYQYKRAMGVPNASPFCMKMETWLRMAGLDYEIRVMADPRKAPLGKLPMIEYNGKQVADSSCIIRNLEQACDVNLDDGLDDHQRATALAYQRMLEEHSYWGIVYGRWIDDRVWPQIREVWFGQLPFGARQLVSSIARKMATRDARGHGLSRHTKEEIMHRVGEDLDAVATQLGDKEYFLDSQPRNIDATVFAFIDNLWAPQIDWDFPPLATRHANLVDYCKRMKNKYFSDLSD